MSAARERPDWSRRTACLVVMSLVCAAFILRALHFDAGLPHVFHSDHIQVEEAADLLRDGEFLDRSPYPPAHVFVLAAVDLAAYPVVRAAGAVPDFTTYRERLANPADGALRHTIARLYTAALGALLPWAVYRLARLRLGRRRAALAAAMLALSPVQTIYGHQTRIHVPGLVALVFAAIPTIRLASPGVGLARAAAAGLACGAVAAIYQLGFLLVASAVAMPWIAGAPWRRALALGAAALGSFAAFLGIVHLASRAAGIVHVLPGSGGFETLGTLGIPKETVGTVGVARVFDKLPSFVAHWVAAEPMVALGAALLGGAAVRAANGALRRALVPFAVYPAILFVALGTTYTEPRYSMSATPFLAVLASEGLARLRSRALAAAAMALALAVPAALSLRYDQLLGRPDSRVELAALLRRLSSYGVPLVVDDALAIHGTVDLPNLERFPPKGDYRPWILQKTETPLDTLRRLDPTIFVQVDLLDHPHLLDPPVLEAFGFELGGHLLASAPGTAPLPDAPDFVAVDLWRCSRPGPALEFWSKRPLGRAILERELPPEVRAVKNHR